jgi:hypothetical protein
MMPIIHYGSQLDPSEIVEVPLALRQLGFPNGPYPRQFMNWMFLQGDDFLQSWMQAQLQFRELDVHGDAWGSGFVNARSGVICFAPDNLDGDIVLQFGQREKRYTPLATYDVQGVDVRGAPGGFSFRRTGGAATRLRISGADLTQVSSTNTFQECATTNTGRFGGEFFANYDGANLIIQRGTTVVTPANTGVNLMASHDSLLFGSTSLGTLEAYDTAPGANFAWTQRFTNSIGPAVRQWGKFIYRKYTSGPYDYLAAYNAPPVGTAGVLTESDRITTWRWPAEGPTTLQFDKEVLYWSGATPVGPLTRHRLIFSPWRWHIFDAPAGLPTTMADGRLFRFDPDYSLSGRWYVSGRFA